MPACAVAGTLNLLEKLRGGEIMKARQTGTITFFDNFRGFGFVLPDGCSDRNDALFVHGGELDGVLDLPYRGQRISFNGELNRNGGRSLRAMGVRRAR